MTQQTIPAASTPIMAPTRSFPGEADPNRNAMPTISPTMAAAALAATDVALAGGSRGRALEAARDAVAKMQEPKPDRRNRPQLPQPDPLAVQKILAGRLLDQNLVAPEDLDELEALEAELARLRDVSADYSPVTIGRKLRAATLEFAVKQTDELAAQIRELKTIGIEESSKVQSHCRQEIDRVGREANPLVARIHEAAAKLLADEVATAVERDQELTRQWMQPYSQSPVIALLRSNCEHFAKLKCLGGNALYGLLKDLVDLRKQAQGAPVASPE